MLTLHLLQISMVYINTLMIERVDRLAVGGGLAEARLRAEPGDEPRSAGRDILIGALLSGPRSPPIGKTVNSRLPCRSRASMPNFDGVNPQRCPSRGV
jgi:hypothetical protein